MSLIVSIPIFWNDSALRGPTDLIYWTDRERIFSFELFIEVKNSASTQ